MKNIYTKTGDHGVTSLRNGVRVAKDDPRIETNGQLDHLNALLGIVRAYSSENSLLPTHHLSLLHKVQRELMVIMSHIATPEGEDNPKERHCETLTQQMEMAIDRLTEDLSLAFVIPGENLCAAYLHAARTQARTCERRLWTLHRTHPLPADIPILINRLADYLFALAISTSHPSIP